MMDKYDKEIFNFFSKQENFEKMLKVSSHKEKIKRMLQTEFWNLIEKKLRDLNSKSGEKWSIKLTGDIFHNYTKLLVYKTSWDKGELLPPLAIAYERLAASNWPFYGLWVNLDIEEMDNDRILKHARSLRTKDKYQIDSHKWWSFWENSGINFTNEEEFVRILPANRNDLIDSFAGIIFDLANEIEEDLDTMAEMTK